MNTGNIVKTIGFMVLLGLFFAYGVSNGIFTGMQQAIVNFNESFFSKLPGEVLFLFTFLIFILIFAFIVSFFRD